MIITEQDEEGEWELATLDGDQENEQLETVVNEIVDPAKHEQATV